MLAVNIPFAAEHDGALIAAAFLEIVRQMRNARFCSDVFANGVDALGIFIRADGKRRREIITAQLFRQGSGGLHTKTVAGKAAFAAFWQMGQPAHCLSITARVIVAFDEINAMRRIDMRNDAPLFGKTMVVFGTWLNVRVIIKNGDFEKRRQIFQHITGTRSTAAVQQQMRHTSILLEIT